MLVATNRITTDDLLTALKLQDESGKKLGECLVDLGHVGADELQTLLGHHQAPVSLDLDRHRIDARLIEQIGIDYCFRHRVVPVSEEDLHRRRMILMAMADPSDVRTIDHVQSALDTRVLPGFAPETSILGTLTRIFPARAVELGLADPERSNPVPRYVEEAVRCRATHLHVDVTPGGSHVAFRVDGILRRLEEIQKPLVPRQLAEWSGHSSLEETSPGLFILPVAGKPWLLRPSMKRSGAATSLAIRFYDPESVHASLERIVLSGVERLTLQEEMQSPTGLVVLSVPPYHAADETFWGLVNLLREQGRPVVVVGAPLPHPDADSLPDLSSLPVAGAARLDDAATPRGDGSATPSPQQRATPALLLYASHSRAELRAALEAARRHLVVLRLETPDGPSALEHLSASAPDLFSSAGILRLLMAQRSLRRICDHCFTPATLQPDILRRFSLTASECLDLKVYRGMGCECCASSPGYRGREIALELVHATTALEEMLVAGRLPEDASSLPRRAGCRTLRRACLDLVHRGLTTVEEFQKLRLADPSGVREATDPLPIPISPSGPQSGAPGRRRGVEQ
jgi:type IV pilus assembly protein PilB